MPNVNRENHSRKSGLGLAITWKIGMKPWDGGGSGKDEG
jgi:hypothetical protein